MSKNTVLLVSITSSLCIAALFSPIRALAQDQPAPMPSAPSAVQQDQPSATSDAQTPAATTPDTTAPDQPLGAPVSAPPPITASSEPQQSSPSHRFWIGPEIGAFFPTGKLKSRFGGTWTSLGIGLGAVRQASTSGTWGLDINLIGRSGSGDHAYFAPIGAQYRIGLAAGGAAVPYVGLSADLAPANISSPQDGVHSGLKFTGGGSAFVGVTFQHAAYIEARYLALGSIDGFNLSGLDLAVGMRF